MTRAVYFDIGETILDRTREYVAWAEWLGVPAHTFSAVFGAMIAQGHPVRDVVARFRPEPDFGTQHRGMVEAGLVPPLAEVDLYPDARATLGALRASGLRVGIVGNQPETISAQLRKLDLPADSIASSQDWHVAKPSPDFYRRLVQDAGCPGRVDLCGGPAGQRHRRGAGLRAERDPSADRSLGAAVPRPRHRDALPGGGRSPSRDP